MVHLNENDNSLIIYSPGSLWYWEVCEDYYSPQYTFGIQGFKKMQQFGPPA